MSKKGNFALLQTNKCFSDDQQRLVRQIDLDLLQSGRYIIWIQTYHYEHINAYQSHEVQKDRGQYEVLFSSKP